MLNVFLGGNCELLHSTDYYHALFHKDGSETEKQAFGGEVPKNYNVICPVRQLSGEWFAARTFDHIMAECLKALSICKLAIFVLDGDAKGIGRGTIMEFQHCARNSIGYRRIWLNALPCGKTLFIPC